MANASFQVGSSLYLVRQSVSAKKGEAKPVEVSTNWYIIIDCSGSMWGNIDKIREQLKRKLPKMVGVKDTVTLFWFSGRGEFGVILKGEPVATLTDLNNVNKAIDRWLRSLGLTGFKEPLLEAAKVCDEVSKANPGNANALAFMSDGCDNQWPRADILKTTETIATKFQSCTFIEYGYYADRNLLSGMAEKAGGSLIFAEDFDRWEPQIEAVLKRKVSSAPKVDVKIPGDPIGGFAYALSDGDLITYAVENGSIKVPEDTKEVFYLAPSVIGLEDAELTLIAKPNAAGQTRVATGSECVLSAAYAAVSLFAVRMQPNIVFPLLKALGDVQYIEQFSVCFGKQKYSDFMDVTKAAAFTQGLRFLKGYDPNKVPREDSFTVLELLQVLASDDANRVLMEHPKFKYSRIGRGRIDSNSVLTEEEQAEIDKLTAEMTSTRDAKKVAELSTKIAAITASKKPPLKFVAKEAPEGYPVDALVYNEDRPNISLRVTKPGTVDITDRITPEAAGKVAYTFPTFQYRNYAIVKDGLVNVEVLPVNVSTETLMKLDKVIVDGLAPADLLTPDTDGTLLINVKCLPVINRKMVKTASAKKLFELQWELVKAGAAQKVYKDYRDKLVGTDTSKGLLEEYGEPLTKWLNELGFTDNGFNPKSVQAESLDVYMGKEMKVGIKSFSSLPKVAEVQDKMAAMTKAASDPKAKPVKMTPSAAIMVPYIEDCEKFMASDAYVKAADKKAAAEGFFTKTARKAILNKRALIFNKAQLLFVVIVGQVWFSEFSSLDENSMDLTLDGQPLNCTVTMKEVEIKI